MTQTPTGVTPQGKRLLWWGGGLLAVLAFGGIVSQFDGSSGPSQDDLTSAVKDVCHQQLDTKLKAPSTASYGGDDVEHTGGARWVATGYVDAENSFGAKVRTYWNCVAIHKGGVNWSVNAWLD